MFLLVIEPYYESRKLRPWQRFSIDLTGSVVTTACPQNNAPLQESYPLRNEELAPTIPTQYSYSESPSSEVRNLSPPTITPDRRQARISQWVNSQSSTSSSLPDFLQLYDEYDFSPAIPITQDTEHPGNSSRTTLNPTEFLSDDSNTSQGTVIPGTPGMDTPPSLSYVFNLLLLIRFMSNIFHISSILNRPRYHRRQLSPDSPTPRR